MRLLPAVPLQHRGIISAAAGCGLRWGECAGLPWSAVDFGSAELRVRQVAVEVSGRLEVRAYPKSRAGVRTLPMPSFVSEALKLRHVGRCPDAELVLGTAADTPVRRSNFRRQVWVPAVVRSGLPPRLRFHDLRHSYATWPISDGVPVNVVRRLMGHEQMTTTLNRYTHDARDYEDVRVRDVFSGLAADDLLTFEGPDDPVGDRE